MCHVVKAPLVQNSVSTKQKRKAWNFKDQQCSFNTAIEREGNDSTKQRDKSKQCAKMAKLKTHSICTGAESVDNLTFAGVLYKQLATLCKQIMMAFTTILSGLETFIQSCSSYLNGKSELAHTFWPWLLVLVVVNLATMLPALAAKSSLFKLHVLGKQFSKTLFIEVQRYIAYTNRTGCCNITMSPESLLPCVDGSQVCYCIGENQMNIYIVNALLRSENKKQSTQKIDRNLYSKEPANFTNESLLPLSSQPMAMAIGYKHIPPNLESTAYTTHLPKPHNLNQQQIVNSPGSTVHSTSIIPVAPPSHKKNSGREITPLNRETRKDVKENTKEIKHLEQSLSTNPQNTAKKATATFFTEYREPQNNKPQKSFPRRACVVYNKEQYSLDPKLLSLPRATKYLVKKRTEISPGRYMAKLELHCAR